MSDVAKRGWGEYPTEEQFKNMSKYQLISWLLEFVEPYEEDVKIEDIRPFAGKWPDLYEDRDYWVYFMMLGSKKTTIHKDCVFPVVDDLFKILYYFYEELEGDRSEDVLIYRLKVKKKEMVMDSSFVWRNQAKFYKESKKTGGSGLGFAANNPERSCSWDYQHIWHTADITKAEFYEVYRDGVPLTGEPPSKEIRKLIIK